MAVLKKAVKTVLLVGVVLLNTPHLLCPLACAAETSVVAKAETPKCPHCTPPKRSEPNSLPPMDRCHCGCCDQSPAVLTSAVTPAEADLQNASLLQLPAILTPMYVSVILPTYERVDYWPPPPTSHPGSQLSILFERFLL